MKEKEEKDNIFSLSLTYLITPWSKAMDTDGL